VNGLYESDLRAVLEFVGEAEAAVGLEPCPPPALESLRALVPSAAASWHEWSVDDGRLRFFLSSADPGRTASIWSAYPEFRHEDPLPGGCPGVGPCPPRLVGRAAALSDLVGTRAFHRTGLYAVICRPLGVEHVMKLFLPVRRGMARGVVLDRCERDYDERDRSVVDLLQPHFLHFEEVARTRRLAAVLAAGAEQHGELVVVNAAGWIEFATTRARRILRSYAALTADGRIAPHVDRRLREPTCRSLTIEDGLRVLDLRRLDGYEGGLILAEHPASAALTSRELQVMALVGDGRSNAEIASALWLAPGTVRKHLENVYAKLGVRSRTAALARLRELDIAAR
jgi:DNA-binding CsgD family transcriptional regulator